MISFRRGLMLGDKKIPGSPHGIRAGSLFSGFTLVEALVVAALIAILASLLLPALGRWSGRAEKIERMQVMRSIGQGIVLHAADHDGLLPGPLWPGQVAEFRASTNGRLTGLLAPYLGIEERPVPYIVESWLPQSVQRAAPAVPARDLRVFVMNMQAEGTAGGVVNPWGSLAASAASLPLRAAAVRASSWALSEAYRTHPAVAGRPWATSTTPSPVFGDQPLALFMDGSVRFFDPSAPQ